MEYMIYEKSHTVPVLLTPKEVGNFSPCSSLIVKVPIFRETSSMAD